MGIYCGLNEQENVKLDSDVYWKEKKEFFPNLVQIINLYFAFYF